MPPTAHWQSLVRKRPEAAPSTALLTDVCNISGKPTALATLIQLSEPKRPIHLVPVCLMMVATHHSSAAFGEGTRLRPGATDPKGRNRTCRIREQDSSRAEGKGGKRYLDSIPTRNVGVTCQRQERVEGRLTFRPNEAIAQCQIPADTRGTLWGQAQGCAGGCEMVVQLIVAGPQKAAERKAGEVCCLASSCRARLCVGGMERLDFHLRGRGGWGDVEAQWGRAAVPLP